MDGALPPATDATQAIRLNRRQMAKAATRQKLLAAARHLFLAVGYADTGIRDIAAHMGMTTGAVFSQVEDKAELWRLAMGGPAPSDDLADEVALLMALYPGWGWLLRANPDGSFFASLQPPGYAPHVEGACWVARGLCPASAIRAARAAEEAARP